MKSKGIKFTTAAFFAAAVIAALVLCGWFASAQSVSFSGGGLESEYDIYEELTVPAGSFGDTAAAASVTYPDGTVYAADRTLTLDQGGIYTAEWRATVGGQLLRHTEQFRVRTKLFTLSSASSSAVYGTDENDVWSHWNSGRSGIMLSLAAGDVFRYNGVFNVYETSVSQYALQFAFAPHTAGQADARNMYVRFTDIYDPENTVTVWLKMNTGESVTTYVMSKACDQPYVGHETVRGESVFHIANTYGTPMYISSGGAWYGEPNADILDLGMYFIEEEQQFWLRANLDIPVAGQISNDFDDTSFQADAWGGFTTGEVTMEIWCESYMEDTVDLLIMGVGGQDLSREYADDTQGPQITVESGDLSQAEEGTGYAGYRYPVAGASAADAYSGGNVSVQARVFYNYGRTGGTYTDYGDTYSFEVPVVNGYFATEYAGSYAICYRAEDWNGNKTEMVKTVRVLPASAAPPVTGLALDTAVTQVQAGNAVDLPAAHSYTGGTGTISVDYSVSLGETPLAVQGDVRNGCWFVPEEAGTYTVSVTATDTLGVSQTVGYEVTVTEPLSPSVGEKVQLPKYLIEGARYELPNIMAKDLSSGRNVAAQIEITDGSGTRAYNGEYAVFTPDSDGTAVIRYHSGGENGVEYRLPVYTVREDNLLALEKYFIAAGGAEIAATASGMRLETDGQDGSAEFIRDILADNLSVQFVIDRSAAAFDRLGFVLTDMYDANQSVRIEIVANGSSSCRIFINGKDSGRRLSSATFTGGSTLTLRYVPSSRSVTADGVTVGISETIFGDAFAGFSSGRVYISFEITGATGSAAAVISAIGGQRMNAGIVSDTTAPAISLGGTYERVGASVGDTVTAYAAAAGDVLDPWCELSLTVTYNGEAVTSADGILLDGVSAARDYVLVLDRAGEYTLNYVATDSSGRSGYSRVRFTVYDNTPPELEIGGSVPETASLGEITLPQASVSDDATESPDVFVSVFDPYGKLTEVNNMRFTASYRGSYLVRYMAIDESGNTALREFTIKVG